MWKYFTALVVLLAAGGLALAQTTLPKEECTDCYANIITQTDTQTIEHVVLGFDTEDEEGPDVDTVAVGNEGLSAAVIVVPESTEPGATTDMFVKSGFARIDQTMTQTISNLGPEVPTAGDGAKGITWNKAIQAAWIRNQGQKELDSVDGVVTIKKEGAYIAQTTTQKIDDIIDYDSRESAKILNVDNKLAMIVDDAEAIIDLAANATSDAKDSQSSTGSIINDVNLTIAGYDP